MNRDSEYAYKHLKDWCGVELGLRAMTGVQNLSKDKELEKEERSLTTTGVSVLQEIIESTDIWLIVYPFDSIPYIRRVALVDSTHSVT